MGNCIKCGGIKDEKNAQRSYCAKCKCIIEKQRYAEKRKLLGKESRRIARNPICKCGIVKENPSEGFCNKCIAFNKRSLVQFRKQYGVVQNPSCSKCGKLKTGSALFHGWCQECQNEDHKKRRADKKAKGLSLFGEKHKRTCNKCEKPKEEKYLNDSFCATCRSAVNAEKRAAIRAAKGLPKWGSGERNPLCTSCGNLKEEIRKNESTCKECERKYRKELRAERRAAKGLRPFGSGRKATCCQCGAIKEDINKGYCALCAALVDSKNRFKKVATDEGKEKERDTWHTKAQNPDFRMKVAARQALNTYVWTGHIKKQPCEICGIKKVDGHHEDYMKPLDVRWLCRKHHMEYHHSKENDTKLKQ